MSFDDEMKEILQIFCEESTEGLDAMETGLLNLDYGQPDLEIINDIFRAAHSIKGGAATFGFTIVSDFTHHVETLLDEMRTGNRPVTAETVDPLLRSVDEIREMMIAIYQGTEPDVTSSVELQQEIEALLEDDIPQAVKAPAIVADSASRSAGEVKPTHSDHWRIQFRPHAEMFKTGNDPLRLFRDLSELCDFTVAADSSKLPYWDALDPETCHLAWILEIHGNASKQQILDIFEWVSESCDIEIESLGQSDETPTPVESAVAIAPSAPAPNQDAAPKPGKTVATNTPDSGSIRVSTEKVDALLNLVGELVITQSMLNRFNEDFDMSQLGELRDGLAELSRSTRELQENAMQIRMLPISFSFSRLPRLVRDLSGKLGKKVALVINGESTELDKTVLEKINDPLVHLVRNSLDHGIETPEERIAAGKPETGTLTLNAYHQGGSIFVEVVDDGAGINPERVLAKAREKGLVRPDEELTQERINNLIFQPGFSTAEQLSDVSGRGVGMDVVRRNVLDLGGNVSVQSEPGVGSTFTIRLPLTMAIVDGQLVRVGRETYVISLLSIIETVQINAERLNTIAGRSEVYRVRSEYIPIIRLYESFDVDSDTSELTGALLVIVEANGQQAGVMVDELLNQQQVVIKSLETNFEVVPGISGATILGDGTVALIIDIPGLIQRFMDASAYTSVRSPQLTEAIVGGTS